MDIPEDPPVGPSGQEGASSPPRLLKAGELARKTGLTRQALHVYVQMGLLVPAALTQGGQRLFDSQAIERVELIRSLMSSGYSLKDIKDIFIHDG